MRASPRLRVIVSLEAARSRLARFVTGSMAVHGLLLAAILVVPATRHRAAPIEDSMVVALAGPIAALPSPPGGAVAAQAAKPAPSPPPAPKDAHTVREVPLEKPKDKPVKPKKEPAKAPAKEPETPTTAPPASAQPAPPAGGQAAHDDAKPGAGAVTATIGGGDTSLVWYGAAVKAALESVWAKPYLEDAQGTSSGPRATSVSCNRAASRASTVRRNAP